MELFKKKTTTEKTESEFVTSEEVLSKVIRNLNILAKNQQEFQAYVESALSVKKEGFEENAVPLYKRVSDEEDVVILRIDAQEIEIRENDVQDAIRALNYLGVDYGSIKRVDKSNSISIEEIPQFFEQKTTRNRESVLELEQYEVKKE
jgi:hypothetical protein